MNYKFKVFVTALLCAVITFSCFEDRDDNGAFASDINDFIWKGMNFWYLYKANIPDLSDDRFSSNEEYADYLNQFSNPPDLFESLAMNGDASTPKTLWPFCLNNPKR